MNCNHVLDLIDAGPFANYPHAHLDAAWAHARQCPTCGPALETMTALPGELHSLPEPATPPDLAGVVMARIAQVSEDETAAAVPANTDRVLIRRVDWMLAATALGGLIAAVALMLTMPTGPGVLTPRLTLAGALAVMPASAPAALALGTGLLIYLAGLFGPLSTRNPSRRADRARV